MMPDIDEAVKNIVVLRPGALGDVLVCRHLLHSLKAAFPGARLLFIAPGERGRLFARFGLADAAPDWENAAFAWLFSADADSAPPALLQTLFTPESLVLAYLDLTPEATAAFKRRLSALAAPLHLFLSPSRPPDGSEKYIGEWLTQNALDFCRTRLLATAFPQDGAGEEFIVDAEPDASTLVIHPGSGSAKKNWPLRSFAALASLLTKGSAAAGLSRIRIIAGEADAALGESLAALLPAAELTKHPSLADLAKILASSALYVGNDSGVTHLAAAVRARTGWKPKVAAVFGPSDPKIWATPATLALRAGGKMDSLSPEAAFSRIRQSFFPDTA